MPGPWAHWVRCSTYYDTAPLFTEATTVPIKYIIYIFSFEENWGFNKIVWKGGAVKMSSLHSRIFAVFKSIVEIITQSLDRHIVRASINYVAMAIDIINENVKITFR